MLHTSLLLIFLLLCNGCATASKSSSISPRFTPIKMEKLVKYASNQGCKMLESGYMVCPKSMNR